LRDISSKTDAFAVKLLKIKLSGIVFSLNWSSNSAQMGDDFPQALLKLSAADGRASRKGE
jgi:hypothetical protein